MIMNSLQLSKHLHIFYNNREREDTPKKAKEKYKRRQELRNMTQCIKNLMCVVVLLVSLKGSRITWVMCVSQIACGEYP